MSSSQLYDGGSYKTPSYYTSTKNITISSGQTIQITTKKASSSLTPSISVYYSSDNGSSWTKAKDFSGTDITSTSVTDDVVVDNIVGSYYLKFELGAVYVSSIIIKDNDPYPTPTDFTLSSFTSTSATFSWSAGNNETAWQFAYSTSSSFTPGTDGTTDDITTSDLSDGKYTKSGLTEGTTYYAAIRANYGSGNYSRWTDKVAFTPSNQIEITKYDGSTASYNIPISSANVNNSTALTQTQFIIPASDLTSIQNRQITKLTFYASRNSLTWGAATFEVYLKETNNTSYSTSDKKFESWGTCVYNNQGLSTNSTNGQMEITLNTPFNYTTGNLMIGFKQLTKGTTPSSTYWYSLQPYTNNAIYSYGTSTYVISYSPKITILTIASNTAPVQIDANGFTTFASPYPLNLTAATQEALGLTAYRAQVFSAEGKVRFYSGINQTVAANTGVLLAGRAGETYQIPVAVSGTAIADNAFEVNSTGGTFDAESGYTYYALKKNSSPLTFGTFNPASVAIPTNKAYVKVDTSGGVKAFTFEFDDTATAISSLNQAQPAVKGAIYDLSGRRVASAANAQLPKGLYIIDGKKVVLK